MRRLVACIGLIVGASLAGCLDAMVDDDDDSARVEIAPDWAERVLVWDSGHDHTDPQHHADLSTPNFQLLGWDPLSTDQYGKPAGSYFCGDAQDTEDGRRLAVVESRTSVAFVLVDVSDAASPQKLGEFVMQGTRVYDLAVVKDGRHVVLTTADVAGSGLPVSDAARDHGTRDESPQTVVGDAESVAPALLWRSSCVPGGEVEVRVDPRTTMNDQEPIPRHASLLLVSIEDPTNPTIVDQRPAAGLGHSVSTAFVDGAHWVLNSVWAATEETSTFQFYHVTQTPAGAILDLQSAYSIAVNTDDDPDSYGRSTGHNDGMIHEHPITGQTLALLAQWDEGIHVLDLADPKQPVFVGQWSDYGPGQTCCGNLHSVYPLPAADDGTHYTLVGPEWPNAPRDMPTGVVWVLDTTNPAQPREVAAWTLPYMPEWSGSLMFSNHYITAVNDTAFVSMYHGGAWALDLSGISPDTFTLLPSVGVYMPVNVVAGGVHQEMRWAPTLEEILSYEDGTLVTFDANSGVYVLRFDPTLPAPSPEPWPIEPYTWTPS